MDQLSRKHWGVDRFRVKALEKMVTSEDLDADQRKATLDMIVEKCRILISGMEKREKTEEAMAWQEKLRRYAALLYDMDV